MTDRGPIIESGSAGAQLASGKVKATRAPPSARFWAQIRPPCACTRPCAIARPRPAPPLERARESSARQKRSNIRCGRVAVQSVTVVFVRDTGSVRLHVRFRGPVGRRRGRGQLSYDLRDPERWLAGRPAIAERRPGCALLNRPRPRSLLRLEHGQQHGQLVPRRPGRPARAGRGRRRHDESGDDRPRLERSLPVRRDRPERNGRRVPRRRRRHAHIDRQRHRTAARHRRHRREVALTSAGARAVRVPAPRRP
jgi:hypothetical protein